MKTFRRVVLPVDGSAAADRGVAYAEQFAKREGMTVDVCSVIDEHCITLPQAGGAVVDPLPLIEGLEASAASSVAMATAVLQRAGVATTATILRGRIVDEIDLFAQQQHADAIVLGTNGRGAIDRLFMGSATLALLRIADVPIITVHADDQLNDGPILVAIDASLASNAALSFAIERARIARTRLHLLHVLQERPFDRISAIGGIRLESARRRALTDAEDALGKAGDRVRAAGVPFGTELARGEPIPAIVSAARLHRAASIAIGTHGRGALERFIVGSVAEGVVRHARVPVFVLRRHDETPRSSRANAPEVISRRTIALSRTR